MTLRIPDRIRPKLWKHQLAALEVIRSYIVAGNARLGSALIRMPTGTGKTGVIAVTAHYLVPNGHVLVLAPWDALVRQLISDLHATFWDRIKLAAPTARAVARLLPSKAAADLAAAGGEQRIYVATIAALEDLHRDAPQVYARLAHSLGAVLVDEGHYEPAPDWSRAVRELGQPVVLFTATPYRNDFKYFKVDPAFRYTYTHEKAEASGHIRRRGRAPRHGQGSDEWMNTSVSWLSLSSAWAPPLHEPRLPAKMSGEIKQEEEPINLLAAAS